MVTVSMAVLEKLREIDESTAAVCEEPDGVETAVDRRNPIILSLA